jgi:hypothetical protein
VRGALGLRMTRAEVALFREVADRDPPGRRVRELWALPGRWSGKDSIAAPVVAHEAASFDPSRLRPGERVLCACLACDRQQASIVLSYTRAFFTEIPALAALVESETQDGFRLRNSVDIAISTDSFRSIRGRSILCAILDEVAFYNSETTSNPDEELYRALRPGLLRVPGSILIGISTPYAKRGLLYRKFSEHYGRESEDVVVVRGASNLFNPTISQEQIDKEVAEDPVGGRAEWLGEFRDDVSGWATREMIEAAVERGVMVRPPRQGLRYASFVDASGGVRDSFTAGVAHLEGNVAVLDCLIEVRAPFNPDAAVAQVAGTLRSYGLNRTTGDRYAALWVSSAFEKLGIRYTQSERDRSAIYSDALPLFTTGRVRLLDNKRLVGQFASLERRATPLGRDIVDHPRGAADDCCNAAAGALVLASAGRGPLIISEAVLARARVPGRHFLVPRLTFQPPVPARRV